MTEKIIKVLYKSREEYCKKEGKRKNKRKYGKKGKIRNSKARKICQ